MNSYIIYRTVARKHNIMTYLQRRNRSSFELESALLKEKEQLDNVLLKWQRQDFQITSIVSGFERMIQHQSREVYDEDYENFERLFLEGLEKWGIEKGYETQHYYDCNYYEGQKLLNECQQLRSKIQSLSNE